MSAKKKPKEPSEEDKREARMLVGLLRCVTTEEEYREIEQRMLNPEKTAAAKRREEEIRRMEEFIGRIPALQSGYRLPAGFANMWDLLIDGYEQEIQKRYQEAGTNPKHLGTIIKRGWVTVNEAKSRLDSHLKMPAKELHPIPTVLFNDTGKWEPPVALSMLIRAHPFVRKFTETLPEPTKQEQIAQAMRWAEACRPDNPDDNHYGTILAQSAERLDLFLYEQAFGDPAEFGWMHAAKQSQQFWDILDAAIGFGRSLQNHEIYGDGLMESMIHRALAPKGGRPKSEPGSKIEYLLEKYLESSDDRVTPRKFLAWLGGNRSKVSDGDEIVFPEGSKGFGLKGISLDKLKNLLKSASRRLKKGING